MNKERTGYKAIEKQIQANCRQEKEAWTNKVCEEIEPLERQNTSIMHKKIKSLSNRKAYASSGCIKSNDGTLVMEREEVLRRWSEYIEELL